MARLFLRRTKQEAARILVLGNYRQTLVALRSLKNAGYRTVLGIVNGPRMMSLERSNSVDEVWSHPPVTSPETFLDALCAYLKGNPDVGRILPVGDSDIAVFAEPAASCCRKFVCMPAPDAVSLCLDKARMEETASACGVPYPQTRVAAGIAELHAAVEETGGGHVLSSRELLLEVLSVIRRFLSTPLPTFLRNFRHGRTI